MRQLFGAQTEEAKVNSGLASFLVQHTPVDTKQALDEISAQVSREAKLKPLSDMFLASQAAQQAELARVSASGTANTKAAASEQLARHTPVSAEQVELAAWAFASKMVMMHKYEPSAKFDGNCLLVRAADSLVKSSAISFDYNLKSAITGQCQVHAAKGDHSTFIANELTYIGRLIDLKLSPV